MSTSLIINARHRLRWHQRLVSDVSTAALWGGWLSLWAPLLRSSAWIAEVGARSQPALLKLHATGSPLEMRYVVALVGTSGTLLMWNRLPARRVPTAEVTSAKDYARHFELSERELAAGRRASVCVVHHDESGRIVQVECRELLDAERHARPEPACEAPADCALALAG